METVLLDTEYRETGELWEDSGIKGRESRAKSHRKQNKAVYRLDISSKKRKS